MNQYLSKLILLFKFIVPIFLIYLVFSSVLVNYTPKGLAYIYNFSKNFKISSLFSASLTSEPQLLLNESIPLDVDVAQPPDLQNSEITEIDVPNPVVISLNDKQNQIDDILEKIDILKQQILDLETIEKVKDPPKIEKPNQQPQPQQQPNNNIQITSYSSGGSNSVILATIYPKILISEVQVSGLVGQKEEFVELYNPNTTEIDLTNWYLQKKTKGGTSYDSFISNTLFSGKKIAGNSYFVIARENSSFVGLSDIITDNSLADDNSLILKNPNGEISDKLGFGLAQEYEANPAQNPEKGKSTGRKWDTVNNTEQDTDNNLADFEAQISTPKAKNITFVAPPDLPPPTPTPTDTTAPEVTFNLDAIQTSLAFTINFTFVDPITTVSPSGIDSYIFRWQKEEIPPVSEWQEDSSVKLSESPISAILTRDFTGQDETTYYFQVKIKDVAGNESGWQPETPATTKISIFKKVLINEIQIDGIVGTGGAGDDWVELYNPNDIAVSLTGWSIQKHSLDDPCSIDVSFYKKNFPNDVIIPAKGLFLIVDTKASESLKTIADMSIGWSLSEDNTIYLVKNQDEISDGNDSDIVDKVGFGVACFSETSPALNPPEAKSIERKELGQDTDDNSQDFKISNEPTPGQSPPVPPLPVPVPEPESEPEPEPEPEIEPVPQ